MSTKEAWENAPQNANYLAQDMDGKWWFYRDRPDLGGIQWLEMAVGGWTPTTAAPSVDWRKTLEARPKIRENNLALMEGV